MTEPIYTDDWVTLFHGDCLEVLPELGTVDHVITDPPYSKHAHTKSRAGALTTDHIEWVLERHLVYEIYHRVQLDIGKVVLEKAPSPVAAIRRFDEIRDYIQEVVAASFREHRAKSVALTVAETARLANSVLEDTFAVFEDYVE